MLIGELMGREALRFFDEANKHGGLLSKMRLASIAKITSTEAVSMEDTQEVLARLEDALQQLRTEAPARPGTSQSTEGMIRTSSSGIQEARALRAHLYTFADLMSQRSLVLATLESAVRRINEAAANMLNVERVSVWFLDSARTKITCTDLYIRSRRKHIDGMELNAADYGPYFAALASERTIAAGDAVNDPRTSCFAESYLKPLGITSMLDIPIWYGDEMVGVVCHEHVGPKRRWTSDEETFAYLLANIVALALDRHLDKSSQGGESTEQPSRVQK